MLARIFAEEGRVGRAAPRDAWMSLTIVEKRLDEAPELRVELEALVPAELVGAMLDAHQALGDALGLTRADDAPEPVDQRQLIAVMVRRIDAYVLCLAAGAATGVPERVARARAALQPIQVVQAFIERRRRRRARAQAVGSGSGSS